MDWFYESNGQQNGPVSESQLDELIRTGSVRQDTLVWSDGMPDWQPLQQVRPSAGVPIGAPPLLPPVIAVGSGLVCAECRRPFAPSEMVQLNRTWVCAQCKPIFLQRLMEGGAPSPMAGVMNGFIWRMDKQMVTRSETPMPDRCVRCNAPAKGFRLKRQLSWHPSAYYLLILVSILIYLIVALCIRKKALLYIGLCETHRTQRNRFIMASWIASLLGVVLLIVAFSRENGFLAFLGGAVLIGGIVFGAIKATVISVGKIDKEFVWVKGADPAFLAEFPEWYGPR